MDKSNLSTAELAKWLDKEGDKAACYEAYEVAEKFHAAATRLQYLEYDLKAAKEMAEDIAGDFVDYVCTGTTNPAPYCKNKCEECTDKYGMCAGVKCIGFAPKAWRAEDEHSC